MQLRFSSLTLLLVVDAALVGSTDGFFAVSPLSPPGFEASTRLADSLEPHNGGDGDSMEDLERARASFESMIGPQVSANMRRSSTTTTATYSPPPLTVSSRKRRLLEMELLASLENDNFAVDELMDLWMFERGAESAQQLQEMEKHCSDGLQKEEEILRSMVEEYGMDWSEPASRLATLLFHTGRLQESMQVADRVLAVKPWHFEVIHLQILNCLRLKDNARLWKLARRALPALNPDTHNRRRKQWVRQALRDAKASLAKAEEALQKHLGETEPISEEESLWQ